MKGLAGLVEKRALQGKSVQHVTEEDAKVLQKHADGRKQRTAHPSAPKMSEG